jgi:tetratricopeptide (TPR) repeat protein
VCRYRDFCRGGCTWTTYCHKGEGGEGNPFCFYYQAVRQGRFDLLTEEPTAPELAFFGGKVQPVVPLAEEPTDATALLAKAHACVNERRFEEAHRLLLSALAQAPDDLPVIDLLGFVCFSLRDYEASEGYNRRALALKPDHAFAHNGLGLCLARQGKLAEGSAAIERAIALLPRWYDPYHDLAVVLAEAGRCDEACAALARGAAAIPNPPPPSPRSRPRFGNMDARQEQGSGLFYPALSPSNFCNTPRDASVIVS